MSIQISKLLLISMFWFSCLISASQVKEGSSERVKIMILGVFHFGETPDAVAVKWNDLYSSARQEQIHKLVTRLKEFNPNKIMVEHQVSYQDVLNAKFQDYLNGKDTLRSSETYQIGFRLAKSLGLDGVIGVDYKLEMPMVALMNYCEENDEIPKLHTLINNAAKFAANESERLSSTDLLDFLASMNTEAYDQILRKMYYQDLMGFGGNENEPGIDYTLAWTKRNMMIMKNILKQVDSPDDRMLLIIGSSHRAGLIPLLEARDDIFVVDVNQYLAK